MKTNMYVFVACLATLLLASCSKETESGKQPEGNALVELIVKGTPTVNGRSTGTLPSQTDENTVNRIAVAIFNSDGTTNTIAEFTTTTGIQFNCTAATGCSGLVVANAPAGHFAGVANKTDFQSKTLNLDVTLNGGAAQNSKCLPMSGEVQDASSNATFDLVAGTTPALKVSLSRLVARISVSSMKTDFTQSGMYPNATFKLTKVFLRDALETAKPGVGGYTNTKPATLSWLHDAASITTSISNLNKPWLKDDVSSVAITATPVTTAYWFYAFANEETTNRTALVLEGTFDPDGTNASTSTVYYPVIVNKSQSGTSITEGGATVTGKAGTIARNTTYNIGVTIKNIGTANPGGNINPADLTLTVSVENWVLDIQQNVEFN